MEAGMDSLAAVDLRNALIDTLLAWSFQPLPPLIFLQCRGHG